MSCEKVRYDDAVAQKKEDALAVPWKISLCLFAWLPVVLGGLGGNLTSKTRFAAPSFTNLMVHFSG